MLNNFQKRINLYRNLFLGMLLRDSWQHIRECDVLLVRHDNDCGYTFHGQVYAQIIDSFGDLCEKRGLTVRSVATPHSRLIGKLAYHSPVSYSRSVSFIYSLGVIVRLLRGLDIGRKWVNEHHMNLWCRILEKATPKCVIGIQPDEHLCKAGKLKRIPVYDLQHGVIANEDPYYGKTYRIDTLSENLPDGFLFWDSQSASTILNWAENKGIRIIITGNPWFLRFWKMHQDDLLVNEAVTEASIITDERPIIVVSLQWGVYADEYPDSVSNTVMGDSLEKVILDTAELYNWIIRIHPIQLRNDDERKIVVNYFNTTFGSEKTHLWLTASNTPLPIILNKADLHITYYSAVVKEAAWMGVRSGLLSKQLNTGGKYQDLFTYERYLGMAEVLPQNPEIIKQWIINEIAKGRGQSTLKDSSQNLDAFIDEIAGRKS